MITLLNIFVKMNCILKTICVFLYVNCTSFKFILGKDCPNQQTSASTTLPSLHNPSPFSGILIAGDMAPVSKQGVILEVPLFFLVLSELWRGLDKKSVAFFFFATDCLLFGACTQPWLLYPYSCAQHIHFSSTVWNLFPFYLQNARKIFLCFREHCLTNWNLSSFHLDFLRLATKCLMMRYVFRTQVIS